MRLNHLPSIQIMVFVFNSLFSLCTLIKLRPYTSSLTNKTEIFNELTIYANTFVSQLFLTNTNHNESTLLDIKGHLGYLVIANICLNMVVNMAIIAI